jgi:DNA-binding MarR family transcriptional regulator
MYRALKEIADGTSYDLTLRQVLLLLNVGSKTSPQSQQQIAESQDLYKSTVSKIIANLTGTGGDVKRKGGLGMLNIDLDPSDYRSRVVSLSKEGERLLTRAMKQAGART